MRSASSQSFSSMIASTALSRTSSATSARTRLPNLESRMERGMWPGRNPGIRSSFPILDLMPANALSTSAAASVKRTVVLFSSVFTIS